MSERPTPETDAFSGNLGDCIKFAEKLERERDEAREWSRELANACDDLRAELAEARELCRELTDLVAYGLGQSGEPWSLAAMRQATTAIQKVKALEAAK